MKQDDKARFMTMLQATAESYGRQLEPAVVELYWQDLAELDFAEFCAGLQRCRKDPEVRFMPTSGQIVAKIHGTPKERALEAWSKFVSAAQTVGGNRGVDFDDPTIHHVVRQMGGWVEMTRWNEKDEPFIRKEFVERYTAIEGRRNGPPPRLLGLLELSNRSNGLPDPDGNRALFGDPDKAMETRLAITDGADSDRRFLQRAKREMQEIELGPDGEVV